MEVCSACGRGGSVSAGAASHDEPAVGFAHEADGRDRFAGLRALEAEDCEAIGVGLGAIPLDIYVAMPEVEREKFKFRRLLAIRVGIV